MLRSANDMARRAGRGMSRARLARGGLRALAPLLAVALLLLAGAARAEAATSDWVVNMTDTGYDPIPVGGTIVYEITVSNNDLPQQSSPATKLFFSIPSGAVFTGGSSSGPRPITNCTATPTTGPGTITCDVPEIPGGQSTRLLASVQATQIGILTVTAEVPKEGDLDDSNNQVSQTTTVTNGTDILLTIASSADTVPSGSAVSYAFTARNLGPDPATNLTLRVPAPTGLSNVVLPAGCAPSGSDYVCSIAGPVAVGASVTRSFGWQVSAQSVSTITVSGSITGSTPPDPITANNTATFNTTVTAGSDVRISKLRSPVGTLLVGGTATFTLTASYTGDSPNDLVITDTVPANYRIDTVTAPGWSCSVVGQRITCTRSSGSGAGANRPLGTVSIATTVLSTGTPVNTATIESGGPFDPNLTNNTASDGGAVIQQPSADLRANKACPADPALVVVGQSYDFTISTTNLGNAPFFGTLSMVDDLPAGLTVTGYTLNGWSCAPPVSVVGPQQITCTRSYSAAAPLAVNATTPAVTLRTLVTGSGPISNSVSVSASGTGRPDLTPENDTASCAVASTAEQGAADIAVLKAASPASVPAGEVETFTIQLVNAGPVDATNVTLTDNLTSLINGNAGPTEAGFISATASDPAGAASNLACTSASSGGTSRRLTCTMDLLKVCRAGVDCPVVTVAVRPGGNAGPRINSARSLSRDVGDPDISNNTGTAIYAVEGRADVSVTKSDTPDPVKAGQNLTYVVTARVTPDGRSQAQDVTITDTLPDNVTFISATPSSGTCGTTPPPLSVTSASQVVCNLGTINSGAQRTVTIVVRPNTGTRGGPITNAVAVSTSTPGDDPANNTASAVTAVGQPELDLLINKTDAPDPIAVAETTVYSLRVTNNGPSAAENIRITDALPAAGLEYVSFAAQPGVTCSTVPAARSLGGTLQCEYPVLPAGQSLTVAVTMEGVARGVHRNTATITSDETALGFDTNPTNNTDAEDTTVVGRVDLEVVSKTPSRASVALLEPFTFAILLRNTAGDNRTDADNVQLSDALPPGMELTAPPNAAVTLGTTTTNSCSGASGATSFTCSFGTMSLGGEVTITVPVRIVAVTASPQSFTNTASAGTTSRDVDPANNQNAGTVTVASASLSGKVFRDFNDSGTLEGDDSGIGGVTITLTGTTPDGSAISRTTTTAADGSYAFTLLPPGTYQVSRGAVSEDGLSIGQSIAGSAGGTATSPSVITAIPLGSTAATGYDFTLIPDTGLSIAKALAAGPVLNGDGSFSASFTLTLANPGRERIDSLAVTDQLAGAAPLFGTYAATPTARGTYTVASAPAGSCGGLRPDFDGSSQNQPATGFSLAPGASCTITFGIRVLPSSPPPPVVDGARYFNQARATGTGSESGRIVRDESERVPLSPGIPRMTLAKALTGTADADATGTVTPGDVLSYTITASNTGTVPLTALEVSDDRITPGSITCPRVEPGESCVLTGTLTVSPADAQAGRIVNVATARSNETGEETATFTVPVSAAGGGASITKTALVSTVKRGERVPYEIVAGQVPFSPARVVDVMPPGFSYVPGTSRVNGAAREPVIDGPRLIYDALEPGGAGKITISLVLVANAAAKPGTAVNTAQLVNPGTGEVVATARARVSVLEEGVFDCTDIIGKVFDDRNRNGYQDAGEPGLPAVRLSTVHGLLVTTDAQGRFNIACADVPDADIGANFIVKLDLRTLPTGYRVTTENPRKLRLTRGKVAELNFGAALTRLVSLDLNGRVFAAGSDQLAPRWQAGLDRLIVALAAEPSILRITYVGKAGGLARARLKAVAAAVQARWKEGGEPYDLPIETRIVSAGAGNAAP